MLSGPGRRDPADYQLISWKLSSILLETIMALPTPMFWLAARLLDYPVPRAPSPFLTDVREGRGAPAGANLRAIVELSRERRVPVPVCDAVHAAIVRIQEAIPSTGSLLPLECLLRELPAHYYGSSVIQLNSYMLRALFVVSLLSVLLFLLIYHE